MPQRPNSLASAERLKLLLVSVVFALAALPAPAQSQLWIRQLGTSGNETAESAAPDGSGGVYVSGYTDGSLGGPNAGSWDAWITRYDGAGNQLWIRQIGTNGQDKAHASAPDGSGGVYVSGVTGGNFGGATAGLTDAWFARYDGAGNLQWLRQLGTSNFDSSFAAAADGSGGVYVSGSTEGSLGGPGAGLSDAWLARYDGAGNQHWVRQLGTFDQDIAFAAAADGSGSVYVGGYTEAGLGGPFAGVYDAWLARYDDAGNLQWLLQLGTSSHEDARAVAPDGSGGVYVVGGTDGFLGGAQAGGADAWLARYDVAGNQLSIRQLGTSLEDYAWAAASDGLGGVYVGGSTNGSLGGPSSGQFDAWLARSYDGCPSPTAYCTAQISSSGCVPSMSASGVPSLVAPGMFHVTGANLEASVNGLMFFGTTGPNNAPFGGGTLCVKAPLYRLSVKNTGGGASCTGTMSNTLLEMLAQPQGGALLVVNQAVNIQTWFRDPSHPSTTGLSNGLQFSVCP